MNRYLQKLDTLGLLLLVAAAIYYSVTNLWDRWTIGLAVGGAVLIVVGIVANYRQILQTLGRRSTKYATNYIVSVVLVIAIVAAVNYLGQRHTKRFDLTAAGRFTLAPQTLQVLDKLNRDLDVKAFFPGRRVRAAQRAADRLSDAQPPRALRIHRSRQAAGRGQAIRRHGLRHLQQPVHRIAAEVRHRRAPVRRPQGKNREAVRRGARRGPHQRHDQGAALRGEEGLLRPGTRRERPGRLRARRLLGRAKGARRPGLQGRDREPGHPGEVPGRREGARARRSDDRTVSHRKWSSSTAS